MSRRCTALAIGLCAAGTLAADDVFEGSLTLGWREVSVSGSDHKYREDTNLPSGPRLAGASFLYRADDPDAPTPDVVEIDISNVGGEPYENLRLEVREFGAYRFRAERRRSAFFYDDIIVLPADASVTGSTGGDFHRFNMERVRDTLNLDITLNPRAALDFAIERFDKRGESTTTLAVQRDEFELDQPVDESMQWLRTGFSYRWPQATLALSTGLREYENRNSVFLPGFSAGESSANPASLSFYVLDQPYQFRSNEHSARLTLSPVTALSVTLNATLIDLDLDIDGEERGSGTTFTGQPFSVSESGNGGIDRRNTLFDIDAAYALNDRVQLIAGARRYQLDQSGQVAFGANDGGRSDWDIDTRGYEVGLAWLAAETLTLTLGWNGERRDTQRTESTPSANGMPRVVDTDRDSVFATLDYRPTPALTLTASVDDHRDDNPFALAAPSEGTRYRLRARYRSEQGWSATATHSDTRRDNDEGQWSFDSRQTDIRLSWSGGGLALSGGFSLVDMSRDYRRLVTGGSRQDLFEVAYLADTSFVDLAATWQIDPRLSIGAHYRAYDNDGSFRVKRDDALGFAEFGMSSRYALRLSYRYLNYAEGGIESYDADIVEAGLRVSF